MDVLGTGPGCSKVQGPPAPQRLCEVFIQYLLLEMKMHSNKKMFKTSKQTQKDETNYQRDKMKKVTKGQKSTQNDQKQTHSQSRGPK